MYSFDPNVEQGAWCCGFLLEGLGIGASGFGFRMSGSRFRV